jgi:Spy/CpxP family protein refolding chaperone
MDEGGGPGGPGSRGGGPGRGNSPTDLLSGKWWTSPLVVRRLGLSEDQQKRIEQIFQQNRLQLIDLRAALEKEEALLDPMLASDHPQEGPVIAQIDHIAAARAELEKANARMLFAFRLVLSPEQWKALQSRDPRGGNMPPGRGRR